MKKKTSPLTLNVKAEGYAMNAQLICEDSQGNKVELTSKGTNRINLGMVRWFINILLLITWVEVFWDSCFGRQFMFQDSNVQSCGKKWYENAWGPEREGGPIFSRHGPLPQIARILLACFAASPLSENLVQAMFWKPCCILLGSAWFAVGLLPAQWQFCFQSVGTVAANLIIGCGSYCELETFIFVWCSCHFQHFACLIVVWLKVSVKLFRQFLGVWSCPELTDRYELYLNR